jgi:hypothetical protein
MAKNSKGESIGGRGKKRGLERTVVALAPEQVDAIREEAMRRMVDRRVGRMDSGEIVREALDDWMRRAAARLAAVQEDLRQVQAKGDAASRAAASSRAKATILEVESELLDRVAAEKSAKKKPRRKP